MTQFANRPTEVDRASFQMINRNISLIFFHYEHDGIARFACESTRGKVLVTVDDPRPTFHNWVLARIKEEILSKELVRA